MSIPRLWIKTDSDGKVQGNFEMRWYQYSYDTNGKIVLCPRSVSTGTNLKWKAEYFQKEYLQKHPEIAFSKQEFLASIEKSQMQAAEDEKAAEDETRRLYGKNFQFSDLLDWKISNAAETCKHMQSVRRYELDQLRFWFGGMQLSEITLKFSRRTSRH